MIILAPCTVPCKFADSSMFWCKISRRNWVLKSLNFSQPVEEGETLHAYERNAASTYCSFNSMRKRGYRQLYSYFCAYKNHLKHGNVCYGNQPAVKTRANHDKRVV